MAVSDRSRKRKRGTLENPPPLPWRTEKERQIYSSKLLHAIRRVRRSAKPAEPPRSRAFRAAADRALAAAAKGRTRWSRAILRRRIVRLKKARRKRSPAPVAPPKTAALILPEERSSSIGGKARVLGRLVPGCRKLDLPNLLEETADYIAALEMQVRTMSVIAELLLASTVGAPAGDRLSSMLSPSSS